MKVNQNGLNPPSIDEGPNRAKVMNDDPGRASIERIDGTLFLVTQHTLTHTTEKNVMGSENSSGRAGGRGLGMHKNLHLPMKTC